MLQTKALYSTTNPCLSWLNDTSQLIALAVKATAPANQLPAATATEDVVGQSISASLTISSTLATNPIVTIALTIIAKMIHQLLQITALAGLNHFSAGE